LSLVAARGRRPRGGGRFAGRIPPGRGRMVMKMDNLLVSWRCKHEC
jgi:hypothetical protein